MAALSSESARGAALSSGTGCRPRLNSGFESPLGAERTRSPRFDAVGEYGPPLISGTEHGPLLKSGNEHRLMLSSKSACRATRPCARRATSTCVNVTGRGTDILACRRNGPVAALSSGFAHRPLLSSGFACRPMLSSGTERRAGLSETARRPSARRHLRERRGCASRGASGHEAPLSSGFACRPMLSSGTVCRPTEARPDPAPGRLPWRRQDETRRGPPGKGTHGRTGDHRLHRDGA